MNRRQCNERFLLHLVNSVMAIGLFSLVGASAADTPIDESLQFNPGYVSEIARQANSMSVQVATVAREALKGKPAQIPASWRLVNVIPKGNDYVMFFQDTDGSVRSLRMQADGGISGHDVVWLRAYR
ncbi:MAG: hypothetical protein LRY53_07040 [Burkholderiaceae bacterium]|nr:hypothetical protein [Burkholderiaceae bacterium]